MFFCLLEPSRMFQKVFGGPLRLFLPRHPSLLSRTRLRRPAPPFCPLQRRSAASARSRRCVQRDPRAFPHRSSPHSPSAPATFFLTSSRFAEGVCGDAIRRPLRDIERSGPPEHREGRSQVFSPKRDEIRDAAKWSTLGTTARGLSLGLRPGLGVD